MEIYGRALEPKEKMMFEGGHFDPLIEQVFEKTMATEIDFLKRKLDLQPLALPHGGNRL